MKISFFYWRQRGIPPNGRLASSLAASFLLSGILLNCLWILPLFAESGSETPAKSPERLSSAFVDVSGDDLGYDKIFLNRILGKPVEMPKSVHQEEVMDGVEKVVWDANPPKFKARTYAVTLRFRPRSSRKRVDEEAVESSAEELSVKAEDVLSMNARSSGDAEVESVLKDEKTEAVVSEEEDQSETLRIEFHEKGVLFTHSHPRFAAHRGGIRFSYRKRLRDYNSMFVDGANGFGAALFVPEAAGKEKRSVMLCPRDVVLREYEEGLRSGMKYQAYVQSRYELTGAIFEVEGSAEGSVLSGHGLGLSRAVALVSRNVIPSKPYYDENFAEDPVSFVQYYADPDVEPDWTAENTAKIAGGIRVGITLQTALGFKQTSWYQDVLRVRKLKMPGGIKMRKAKGWGTLSRGICHLVYRENLTRTTYSKEPLHIPEGFRPRDKKKDTGEETWEEVSPWG